MVCKIKQSDKAEPLFENWQETMVWSCLKNIMGHIYVDDMEDPGSAMAVLGDFCFLAGCPNVELLAYIPELSQQDFMIIVPQNDEWAALIEQYYKENARKVTRYAFKKEQRVFDTEKLKAIASALPDDYTMVMIDEAVFHRCRQIEWCRDFVNQYSDYDFYHSHGLGMVILNADGEIVSGASSYSSYSDGIEIEIDTREDYRRKGLAYACGARLILECLKKGWYPSWDAQNLWSVALAEKLGYHYDHSYTAYEIQDYHN